MDNLASPSCLFTYSVGASCSHAAVMCWIVSDSYPHLLHFSSVSGCFKIYFLLFLVSMTLLLLLLLLVDVLWTKTSSIASLKFKILKVTAFYYLATD